MWQIRPNVFPKGLLKTVAVLLLPSSGFKVAPWSFPPRGRGKWTGKKAAGEEEKMKGTDSVGEGTRHEKEAGAPCAEGCTSVPLMPSTASYCCPPETSA